MDENDSDYKRKMLEAIREDIFIKSPPSNQPSPQPSDEEDTDSDNDQEGLLEEDEEEDEINEITKYILILNFIDCDGKRSIDIEWDEINHNNKDTILKKYLWLGNTPDKTNQYLTTNSNMFDRYYNADAEKDATSKNPMDVLKDSFESNQLKQVLETIIENYYLFVQQDPNKKKGKIIIDFRKFTELDKMVREVKKHVDEYKNIQNKKERNEKIKDIKDVIPFITNDLVESIIATEYSEKSIKELIFEEVRSDNKKVKKIMEAILGPKVKDLVLVTPKYNGELIIDREEYIDFLYSEKYPSLGDKKHCDLCNEEADACDSGYFKKTWIKFFNQDKRIFAPGLEDKRYNEVFNMCHQCFKKLTLGEIYTKFNLKLRWFDRNLFIIPEIKPIDLLETEDLEEIVSRTKTYNKNLYRITDNIRNLEMQIEEIMGFTGNATLTYNYLFYSTDQGGRPNKIQLMIKDVPPSRLKKISQAFNHINDNPDKLHTYPISLLSIYLTIPIRLDKTSKESKEKQTIFSLIECMFKKLPINLNHYIATCLKTIKTITLNNKSALEGFNIKNENEISSLIKMNEIITFFFEIGCINPTIKSEYVITMEEKSIRADPEGKQTKMGQILSYWEGKEIYNKEECRAMFILGVMMAEVGSAQYKKLDNEPILKKVNYDGMNWNQVIQLATNIEGKLRDYKLLRYGNINLLVQEFHQYFEKVEQEKWSLLPSANVFFIMSGYAFLKSLIFTNRVNTENDQATVPEQTV